MPGPVPIVSPVVPLFVAPLLILVPWLLGRLAPVAAPLVWLGLAGEIAESPIVVVEPVLGFVIVKALSDVGVPSCFLIPAVPKFASACSRPSAKRRNAGILPADCPFQSRQRLLFRAPARQRAEFPNARAFSDRPF